MPTGDFYLKFTSEFLRELCDCLFGSSVANWWAVCPFCFWHCLKRISSWNNLINIIFILFVFFSPFGPALFSFPFYCLLWWWPHVWEAFISIAEQSGFLKSGTPFEQRNWAKLTRQMWCLILMAWRAQDISLYFHFSTSVMCSCDHAVLDFASLFQCYMGPHWVCASRCSSRAAVSCDLCVLLLAAPLFCLESVILLLVQTLEILLLDWPFFLLVRTWM